MTADKPHAADQTFEKQSVVPGDKPPAGTPSHIRFNNMGNCLVPLGFRVQTSFLDGAFQQ